jgi:hypothetical protein
MQRLSRRAHPHVRVDVSPSHRPSTPEQTAVLCALQNLQVCVQSVAAAKVRSVTTEGVSDWLRPVIFRVE